MLTNCRSRLPIKRRLPPQRLCKQAQETGIALNVALAVFTYFSSKCHTLVAHNLAFDLQIIQREVNLLKYM